MQDWKKAKISFLTVRCCKNCNSTLSDRGLFTPLSRVTWVRSKLETRYERESTLWSEEEIAEMSPQFQKSIRGRAALLRILIERIRAAQWREMVEAGVAEHD